MKVRQRTLEQRKALLYDCEKCRQHIKERLELEPRLNGEDVGQLEDFHALFHAAIAPILCSAPAQLSAQARAALTCAPSSADKQAFLFQTMFMKIVERQPENNKMDPERSIPEWIYGIVDYVLEDAVRASQAFSALPGGRLNEENMRPWMLGLALGLTKLFTSQNEVVCQDSGSFCYRKVVCEETGDCFLVLCSPPVQDMHEQTGQDKETGKRWKGDLVLYTKMRVLVDGKWKEELIPAKYVEMKDKESENDMWQAVLTASNFVVHRLDNENLTSRMYVEIWSGKGWRYAVLDVFGAIVVKNGQVDEEAFKGYIMRQNRIKTAMGANFPSSHFEEHALRSVQEFQAHYDSMRDKFSLKFSCQLPEQLPRQMFPVGTVYVDHRCRELPVVGPLCSDVKAAQWITGEIASMLGDKSIADPEQFIKRKSLADAELKLATRKHVYRTRPVPDPGTDGNDMQQLLQAREDDAHTIAALRWELDQERKRGRDRDKAITQLMSKKLKNEF